MKKHFLIISAVIAWAFSSSAFAVKKPDLSAFGQKATGNSIQIGPVQKNSTWPTTASVDMSRPGGVGSPIGNSGWYVGPTPGPASGTTMHMTHGGDVFFAGTKYPFQAGYEVKGTDLFQAASLVFKSTPAALVASFLLPGFIDWLTLNDVKKNPDQSDPDNPFLMGRDVAAMGYRVGSAPWAESKSSACSAFANHGNQPGLSCSVKSTANNYCSASCTRSSDGAKFDKAGPFESETRTFKKDMPASLDDIAPYMQKRPEPNIVSDLFDKGMDLPLGTPTVTGPATTPGTSETKTENKSDGSTVTTTTTTTNNYKTEGDTITKTNTTTNTVVNTCNAQGACTTETSSNVTVTPDAAETEKEPETPPTDNPLSEVPDLYERKYPDGMEGVWNTYKDQLKNTSLGTLASKLMPNIPDGGTCPQWPINLDMAQWAAFGTHDVAPPCYIWGIAKAILVVSALLLARALIFGG